ncbi:MAG: AzlC family ABC transporter permease [Oxalobacter sp.]|nr:AzlC family ABC transporter permease [Oxalobacter sp.]
MSLAAEISPAKKQDAWQGIKDALPVTIGFIPFALLLGAQASRKGLSAVEVPLMTALNFAGGSEFAAIELWSSPPHILLIVAMTFLVNSRHMLMSATLAPLIRHLPRRKALLALFFMCDESWALGLSHARKRADAGEIPVFSLPYYTSVAGTLYLSWVLFTASGAILGPVLGDMETYGFDMAFPAVFFVLLKGMWQGKRTALPWLASLLAAALTCRFLPGAWYVAAGALTGLAVAFWGARKHDS